jgi:tRNA/rRNA methyltransferase
VAIEIVNADEGDVVRKDRAARGAWLAERGYRVVEMTAGEIESDLARVLERLSDQVERQQPSS